MPDDYLTTGQIAERVGKHRTTVHHWVAQGRLTPVMEVNGVRLFAAADVDRLAAELAEQGAA